MRLKLATFNFWGLPWPFSVRKKDRLRMLVRMIQQEQFDILACQEIWLNQDIAYLVRQLPEYHTCEQRPRLYNRSGLLLLSRLPLSCSLIIPYDMPMITYEFPSQKGVLRAEVQLNGMTVQLINTHVLYTPNAEQTKLQKRQLDQLIKALNTKPTILFGDFNREYSVLNLPSHFHLISEASEPSIRITNPFANKRLNKINPSDRLPDYIFANFDVRTVKTYFITDPIMSDHYPVVSEIEV